MSIWRLGMYTWTAASAGWFAVAVKIDSLDALALCLACALMAAVWPRT